MCQNHMYPNLDRLYLLSCELQVFNRIRTSVQLYCSLNNILITLRHLPVTSIIFIKRQSVKNESVSYIGQPYSRHCAFNLVQLHFIEFC